VGGCDAAHPSASTAGATGRLRLIGPLQRLFEHVDAKPGEYSEEDISSYFWRNGAFPQTEGYRRLFDSGFADYRLRVHGLVEHPVEPSLAEVRALPHHQQVSQHFCIQGWSGVARWGGVSMATILDLVRPKPEARWVVFYSRRRAGGGPLLRCAPHRADAQPAGHGRLRRNECCNWRRHRPSPVMEDATMSTTPGRFAGLDLVPVAADIATEEGAQAVVAAAGGRVDALANVAGIMDAFLPPAEVDDASNVNGTILPSDGGWSAI
jgi:hypothetical protein